MRTTRTLLALAAAVLLSACAGDSTAPLLPGDRAQRDGTGWTGSGNFVGDSTTVSTSDGTGLTESDSTTERGTGWTGSGN